VTLSLPTTLSLAHFTFSWFCAPDVFLMPLYTLSCHTLFSFISFPDYINVGLQGFVVLMLLYYTKEESQEIWSQGWRK
jgi:hypothetical protein